eukprot:768800-Hanusia_phi.AAC.9
MECHGQIEQLGHKLVRSKVQDGSQGRINEKAAWEQSNHLEGFKNRSISSAPTQIPVYTMLHLQSILFSAQEQISRQPHLVLVWRWVISQQGVHRHHESCHRTVRQTPLHIRTPTWRAKSALRAMLIRELTASSAREQATNKNSLPASAQDAILSWNFQYLLQLQHDTLEI